MDVGRALSSSLSHTPAPSHTQVSRGAEERHRTSHGGGRAEHQPASVQRSGVRAVDVAAGWTRAVERGEAAGGLRKHAGCVTLQAPIHTSFIYSSVTLWSGVEGGRSACVLASRFASWWGVDTRVGCHQRSFGGRRMRPPHTHPAPPRCTAPATRSHRTSPTTPQQRQHLQLHRVCHPVQAVGATVPPSAAHTG